jgi:hypothetical protein
MEENKVMDPRRIYNSILGSGVVLLVGTNHPVHPDTLVELWY